MFELLAPVESECKGIIYRGTVSMCNTSRGFMQTIRLNKLKRMSCSGCSKCGWQDDIYGMFCVEENPILGFETIEDQKLYTLNICNEQTDWETGYVDAYDIEVNEYIPKEINDETI